MATNITQLSDLPPAPLVTLPEFAAQLGVTYAQARRMAEGPDFPEPTINLGNRRVWDDDTLKAYVGARYAHVLDYLGL
jgi:hypothetical protein